MNKKSLHHHVLVAILKTYYLYETQNFLKSVINTLYNLLKTIKTCIFIGKQINVRRFKESGTSYLNNQF